MSSLSDGQDASLYYLQRDVDQQIYRLAFCENITLDGVVPNSRVTIEFSKASGGVMQTCTVPKLKEGRRLLFGDTISTPRKPTFLFYITTFCGFGETPAATPQVCAFGCAEGWCVGILRVRVSVDDRTFTCSLLAHVKRQGGREAVAAGYTSPCVGSPCVNGNPCLQHSAEGGAAF